MLYLHYGTYEFIYNTCIKCWQNLSAVQFSFSLTHVLRSLFLFCLFFCPSSCLNWCLKNRNIHSVTFCCRCIYFIQLKSKHDVILVFDHTLQKKLWLCTKEKYLKCDLKGNFIHFSSSFLLFYFGKWMYINGLNISHCIRSTKTYSLWVGSSADQHIGASCWVSWSHLDCQRLPLFHTLPKEGSQLASVCELWSKLAPTLFGGSFLSFSCSSGKRQTRSFYLHSYYFITNFIRLH